MKAKKVKENGYTNLDEMKLDFEFIKKVLSVLYCERNNINTGFKDYYHHANDFSSLALMSSEGYDSKSLMKLCESLKWDESVYHASSFNEKNLNGKDVVIIDNSCSDLDSILETSKLLKNSNAGNVYLAVSNMTNEDVSNNVESSHFSKVFTTNRKYVSTQNQDGLTVIPFQF